MSESCAKQMVGLWLMVYGFVSEGKVAFGETGTESFSGCTILYMGHETDLP